MVQQECRVILEPQHTECTHVTDVIVKWYLRVILKTTCIRIASTARPEGSTFPGSLNSEHIFPNV